MLIYRYKSEPGGDGKAGYSHDGREDRADHDMWHEERYRDNDPNRRVQSGDPSRARSWPDTTSSVALPDSWSRRHLVVWTRLRVNGSIRWDDLANPSRPDQTEHD